MQFAATGDAEYHLAQRAAGGVFFRFQFVEAIECVLDALDGMAYVPVAVARLDVQFGQVTDGLHGADVVQRVGGGGHQFAVLGIVQFAFAATADEQDAVAEGVGDVVQQQGLADLAFHVAATDDVRDKAIADLIETFGGG